EGGLEVVGDCSLVRPELHAEESADALDLRPRAGEEVPALGLGAGRARVARQNLGRVVLRVERHGEKDDVPVEARLKALPQGGEVRRYARAVVGQRASRVDEVQGDGLPAQAGE